MNCVNLLLILLMIDVNYMSLANHPEFKNKNINYELIPRFKI